MVWPFRVTDPLLDVLEVLLAADDELHGWAIMKQTHRTGPTVYQVLERLRKARWVECWWEERTEAVDNSGAGLGSDDHSAGVRENVPRRRYYRLSGEGAVQAPALLTERGRRDRNPKGRAVPGLASHPVRLRPRTGGAQ